METLAWFAMIASLINAFTYPLTHDINLVEYENLQKFKIAWLRTALEALIITLLALRVLGTI